MKLHELLEATTKYKERSILSVMGKQPEHVDGDFYCSDNKLTSLEGAPSSVGGYFVCSRNKLTSLKGGPTSVGGYFYCSRNKLTSLKGAPTFVGGDFNCPRNNITSLEGAPSSIGGDFSCPGNNITSLHNIHKHIKHIGSYADFNNNPITSCVLGLLLIDGLTHVYIHHIEVQKIINKHLSGDRDVFACQEELIEAGYEDYAQL